MRDDISVQSESLGADLRALRHARGLTLVELAEALGRSVGWISQVERDRSKPSINDLRAIAAYFDVPISLFFGQSDAPEA
ncbi:MAG: helix-turn-helix transcriptional regulator, partial [Alphaproteobacteria bacterium]|nr:helix-turn-helix transcriptional regulator [Alphaproteobacteria bacterium]